ncbi:hypothetical protein GBP98_24845 [Mycobacterium avium subsp. hominissuis]|nr:hypothetical protein [Mycobacterium avium subsp. hominissuis]ORX13087.1 hypothetical protein AWC32_15750 [Mycobacterium xenopi]
MPYRTGVDRALVDKAAARATLVERGLSTLAADEFLMRSLLTATEVATVLGVKDSRAARDTLRRWGVKPIGRGPGRSGENTYPADLVWHHHQHRPGRGWRKGQSAPGSTRQKEHSMHSVVEVDQQSAYLPGYAGQAPWYADHGEVVALASVLVDADWLSTPRDVVDFFEKPWKWDDQFKIWVAAGRPQPPSPNDRVQARFLGQGTMRRELERRYQDDTARWEAFIESLDSSVISEDPDGSDVPAVDHTASNVRPLKRPRTHKDRG